MLKKDFDEKQPGLYHVVWKQMNRPASIAAIGILPNGSRWIAPCDVELPDVNETTYKDIEKLSLLYHKVPQKKLPPGCSAHRYFREGCFYCEQLPKVMTKSKIAFEFDHYRGDNTYQFFEGNDMFLYRRSLNGCWEKAVGDVWVQVYNTRTLDAACKRKLSKPRR